MSIVQCYKLYVYVMTLLVIGWVHFVSKCCPMLSFSNARSATLVSLGVREIGWHVRGCARMTVTKWLQGIGLVGKILSCDKIRLLILP